MNAAGFLEIVSPGLMTSVQDLGRFGSQALGMPVAGATDPIALRLANAVLGNPENTAALEIGYLGPTLVAAVDGVRVVLGGKAKLTLQPADGGEARSLKPWRSLLLRRGDRLAIGAVEEASIAYLAVAGGFAIAPFMGSFSTYMRSGLGGFDGRALKAGDRLPLNVVAAEGDERELADEIDYGGGPIRVVLGPQEDRFTPNGIETFLSATYTVTKEADRMGIRLDGETVEHVRGADIASEGVVTGSIQVPGNGKPIILMADRQTTGGYTKIATVISADLPRVGRMKPGDTLQFAAVTVAEAEAVRREQEKQVRRLIDGIRTAMPDVTLDLNALYTQNLISGAVDAPSGQWR
ncbi:MAG: biotin-dependent carboxyltransferase family protein [Ferrovibrio sp.]|uniref:5-oxoprolinase subunit C family protein n=1 Tax=Ferrovibrio sp. TaxID=1917215 RepID=UPI0026160890|nr:biotin-dependent carboxyltransferase family protein [Ferrovibrio sp.]MCW0234878.1 biotin-dependent carboxyltransferase family protein [Ferrovibrio sp.]